MDAVMRRAAGLSPKYGLAAMQQMSALGIIRFFVQHDQSDNV